MEFTQENALVVAAVIGGLGIILAIVTILFKFAMWMQKVNSDSDILKADTNTLKADSETLKADINTLKVDSSALKADINTLKADNATFKNFMKEIREGMNKTHEKLDNIIDHDYKGTFASESPIHLNELDEKISGEIQARQWAEKAATEFIEKVRDKQPYEIQEMCFEHIQKTFKPDSELDAKIGTAAYEHGIKRDKVLAVLVIELRDVLLKSIKQKDRNQ